MQRALIQYRDPKNYDLVLEALHKTGRMDLVGYDRHCLIRPRKEQGNVRQGGEAPEKRPGFQRKPEEKDDPEYS